MTQLPGGMKTGQVRRIKFLIFGNGWAVYGEFQTAKGSKMKTPYQYNIGARYIF